jgi:hypothetical protein
MNRPLFPTTLREIGRAKDLSALPRTAFWNVTQYSLLKLIDVKEKPAGIQIRKTRRAERNYARYSGKQNLQRN